MATIKLKFWWNRNVRNIRPVPTILVQTITISFDSYPKFTLSASIVFTKTLRKNLRRINERSNEKSIRRTIVHHIKYTFQRLFKRKMYAIVLPTSKYQFNRDLKNRSSPDNPFNAIFSTLFRTLYYMLRLRIVISIHVDEISLRVSDYPFYILLYRMFIR